MNLFDSLPEDVKRIIFLFLSIGDYNKISSTIINNPSDVFWRLKLASCLPEMVVINYKTLYEKIYYQNLLNNLDTQNVDNIVKFLDDDIFLQNYVHLRISGTSLSLLGRLCSLHGTGKYIKKLLSKANLNLLKPCISSATVNAVYYHDIEIIKLLLDTSMSIFGTYKDPAFPNITPLTTAVLNRDFEKIKLLVEYGADVHEKGHYLHSPLELARGEGYAEIADYLEKVKKP
jgi:hypothetical protein